MTSSRALITIGLASSLWFVGIACEQTRGDAIEQRQAALDLDAQHGQLQGRLLWNGSPVPGTTDFMVGEAPVVGNQVVFSSIASVSGTGNYASAALDPRAYFLVAATTWCHDEFAPEGSAATVVGGQITTADVDITLYAGRVTGALTIGGVPVPPDTSVDVTLLCGSGFFGTFTTTVSQLLGRVLPTGNYTAVVASGGQVGRFSIPVTGGLTTDLGTLDAPVGSINGTVIWNGAVITGSDAQGFTVSGQSPFGGCLGLGIPICTPYRAPWISAVDATGHYASGNVPPDDYGVRLTGFSCASAEGSDGFGSSVVHLGVGETVTSNFDITNRAGVVNGSIRSGNSRVKANLIINGGDCGTLSPNADGTFHAFMPPGDYGAQAMDAAGVVIAAFSLSIQAGEVTSFEATPGSGGLLATLLWDGEVPTGRRVNGITVQGSFGTLAVDPSTGTASTDGLDPGTYTASVWIGDQLVNETPFVVNAGATTELTIDLSDNVGLVVGGITVNGQVQPGVHTIADVDIGIDGSGHFEQFLPARTRWDSFVYDAASNILGRIFLTSDAGVTADVGTVDFATTQASGARCTSGTTCASGSCIDAFCCDVPCDGGCQACTVAKGATADGTCTTLPQGHVCRTAVTTCDVAEICDGISPDCPNDAVQSATFVCQAAANPCQSAAKCSGTSNVLTCPAPSAIPNCSLFQIDTPASAIDQGALQMIGPDMSGLWSMSIEFLNGVAVGGVTSVGVLTSGSPPPTGYAIVGEAGPRYWDFSTTAVLNNSHQIKICIHYDPTKVSGSESSLLMFHDASQPPGSAPWVQLPTSINPSADIICGQTTSLSPFMIAEKIDGTPPVLGGVPGTIVAYATGTAGAVVSYAPPTAVDALDGPVGVSCTPAPGSLFAPGKKSVGCTATDAAGNAAPAGFTVWVQYQAPADGTFFLPTINADGSSIVKQGSTLPVKFKLLGASARITNLAARLLVAKLSNGVIRSYTAASSTAAYDRNAFRYDPDSKQYVFDLSTKGMAAGTWSLRADLGDAVDHVVKVTLR